MKYILVSRLNNENITKNQAIEFLRQAGHPNVYSYFVSQNGSVESLNPEVEAPFIGIMFAGYTVNRSVEAAIEKILRKSVSSYDLDTIVVDANTLLKHSPSLKSLRLMEDLTEPDETTILACRRLTEISSVIGMAGIPQPILKEADETSIPTKEVTLDNTSEEVMEAEVETESESEGLEEEPVEKPKPKRRKRSSNARNSKSSESAS